MSATKTAPPGTGSPFVLLNIASQLVLGVLGAYVAFAKYVFELAEIISLKVLQYGLIALFIASFISIAVGWTLLLILSARWSHYHEESGQ